MGREDRQAGAQPSAGKARRAASAQSRAGAGSDKDRRAAEKHRAQAKAAYEKRAAKERKQQQARRRQADERKARDAAKAGRRTAPRKPAARPKRAAGDKRGEVRVRTIVLKAVACAAVVGSALAGALLSGDADYRPTAVGWIPFVAVVAAIALAFAYVHVLARGLKVEEGLQAATCRRGDAVELKIRLKNTLPLFFFRVQARLYVNDREGGVISEANSTLAISPFQSHDMAIAVRFDHIGTFSAGIDNIVVHDFLRLFWRTIPCERTAAVQVVPRVMPLEKVLFSKDATIERVRSLRSTLADSLDYAMVRDYVPGDPLKTIHWKLSARTEGYMTRLFEVHNSPGLAILMDFSIPGDEEGLMRGMLDTIVESSLSLAHYAHDSGMDVQLCYVNRHGERVRRVSWDDSELASIVDELPYALDGISASGEAIDYLRELSFSQKGESNIALCGADFSSDALSVLIEAKARRRNPMMMAVVPRDLIGREREDYCAPLGRLDHAGIGYVILSDSDELKGASV